MYNRGPRITGRGNGKVAQGIFGDGVGGIVCGAEGGGCVVWNGSGRGGARSDAGYGGSAAGVRCGAGVWAGGFDDDVFRGGEASSDFVEFGGADGGGGELARDDGGAV